VYVPNSGDGLKRLEYRIGSWDIDFASYLAGLSEKKPVILTGEGQLLISATQFRRYDRSMQGTWEKEKQSSRT
jgi:exonuclease III